VAAEKIKILHNKKPVPASKKTVSDVLEGRDREKGKTVELGVMIMGGVPDPPVMSGATSRAEATPSGLGGVADTSASPPPEGMEGIETVSSPPIGQGLSGKEVLETDEFWMDLQGYLQQRLKDEAQAVRLVQKWKSSWDPA
jgi:ubiquitin-like protein 4